MAFACPACEAAIVSSPESFLLRCAACGALLRARPADTSGRAPAYDVEVAGRPATRRRVELPWDEAQQRRLRAWLAWASVVTLALVVLLYALARWL